MSRRVVFMSMGGDGVDAMPSQVHLRDGSTLRPILSGGAANVFAVPVAFAGDLRSAGFEAQSDLANRLRQGGTSERPVSPTEEQSFYDLDLNRLAIFRAGAWRDSATGQVI